MPTLGFFSQNFDDTFRKWSSDENIKYIQREASRRLRQKYLETIEPEYDWVRSMLLHTITTWRGPLTLDELLEMVICNFVTDIDTDIESRNRFNSFNPRTLYFQGTNLTREEKVKLKPSYKFVFNMNY